jgi:hypothetical protein
LQTVGHELELHGVSSSQILSRRSDEALMTSPHLTLRQPSAFLPIVMSLAARTLVLGQVALVGVARQADEGAAAHLWQLLVVAQAPIVAFFAIRYLP